MSCNICCETYKGRGRKQTECGQCHYQACSKCIERCILDSDNSGKCPNCAHQYSVLWLYQNLPSTWLKTEYKNHRKTKIHTLERLMDTNSKIFERRLKVINSQKEILRLKSLLVRTGDPSVQDEITALETDLIYDKCDDMSTTRSIKCGSTGCMGYYMASHCFESGDVLQCSTCSNRVCMKCREQPHANECNPEVLMSVRIIEASMVKCPKCGVACEKKSGCNQVSCLFCHTNFNSETGVIDKGHAHNPDFIDWIRSEKMKTADMDTYNDGVCGTTLPNHNYLMSLIEDTNSSRNNDNLDKLLMNLEDSYAILYPLEDAISMLKDDSFSKNIQDVIMKSNLFHQQNEASKRKLHNQYYKLMTQHEYGATILPYFETQYLIGRDILRKLARDPKMDNVKNCISELTTFLSIQQNQMDLVRSACVAVLGIQTLLVK